MSDVNKNLDITIGAKDEASGVFSSAFANLKSQAKSMNLEARQSGDQALERMLKGGGALGIVTLLGEGLKKTTEEAVKLSNEFAEGKINAADMVLEIGKSLPVLGGFFSAGESINELFTHQKRDIADINAEIKAGNEAMELRVKIQKESIKAEEDLADRTRRANQQLALANASGPQAKEAVGEANKLKDIQADKEKDEKKKAEDRRKQADDEIKAIQKDGEAQKEVLENRAHDSLSIWHKLDSMGGGNFGGGKEAEEDAKRNAGLEAEAETNAKIKAANKRADDDIAQYNKGRGEEAGIKTKTVEVEASQKHAQEVKKTWGEIGHAAEKAFEEAQRIAKKNVEEQKQDDKAAARLKAENDRKAEEAANKHTQIQHALAQGKIDMLQQEARAGDLAAGREAERLKIAEEYAQKKAEIIKLTEGATAADKAALKGESDQLDKQKAAALAALSIVDLKPQIKALEEPVKYAGFEDFRKTGGIMDAQRERDKKGANDQIKHLIDISKYLANLDGKIPKIPENAMSGGDGAWDSALA